MVVQVIRIHVGGDQHLKPFAPDLAGQRHADLVALLRGNLTLAETLVGMECHHAVCFTKALLHSPHIFPRMVCPAMDAGDELGALVQLGLGIVLCVVQRLGKGIVFGFVWVRRIIKDTLQAMLKFYGDDVRNRAIAKAAAGSDARMSGCELPVVINSGSGNQGITVSVPVIEYAKALAVPKDRLYRALALSNLIAIHEKTGIGRLSAYCGAVSAGCAAGCGIAYLQGADLKAISHTLVNSLAIVSGIICDGAKPSCAAKIASSVQAGIMGYHMYQNCQQFRGGDGIVTKGVENTIRNVSQLGREGMRETDKEIVKIMLQES